MREASRAGIEVDVTAFDIYILRHLFHTFKGWRTRGWLAPSVAPTVSWFRPGTGCQA